MVVIDLNVNKSMLDVKFEGYKLSLDPIPVLKQPVVDGIHFAELGSDDYSYMQTRMGLLHNYLFQDPWCQNSVFYVNKKCNVLWTSLGEDGRLTVPRCVWNIPQSTEGCLSNISMCFPSAEWALLCDGTSNLYILYTSSRDAGEPWMSYHSFNLDMGSSGYLLNAVHRSTPSSQQIDCVIATAKHKSKLSPNISFPECHTFVSILEWLSLTCGQNSQVWSIKQTRRLAGTSFPEYAAIDNIGDAICVVSQSDFKFFNSEGIISPVIEPVKKASQDMKYTYIQNLEDITIYFRIPPNLRKADIKINFLPRHLEVFIQGKRVLSGDLANCIAKDDCTWLLDEEKLEVILTKAEVGLVWQELIKGDKEGEELMDPALIEEVHARLASLVSDSEFIPSENISFNLDQLEECDTSDEQLTFQRLDGNNHQETHRINMGGHQWLFVSQTCPESLPTICLRHDVDGILWQPKNVFSEGTMEHFKMEHLATFSALGYVVASKQDKKFTSCSPDFQFSVISDCSRHLYLYCQPENLNSALQLRNRKTGESIAHIAKQYVISLEDCDKMLGLQVSSQCVFVLSKDTLYAAKVASK